jgi:lipoprotein signal peptidase
MSQTQLLSDLIFNQCRNSGFSFSFFLQIELFVFNYLVILRVYIYFIFISFRSRKMRAKQGMETHTTTKITKFSTLNLSDAVLT